MCGGGACVYGSRLIIIIHVIFHFQYDGANLISINSDGEHNFVVNTLTTIDIGQVKYVCHVNTLLTHTLPAIELGVLTVSYTDSGLLQLYNCFVAKCHRAIF